MTDDELDMDLAEAWDSEARGASDIEILAMARVAVPRLVAELRRLRALEADGVPIGELVPDAGVAAGELDDVLADVRRQAVFHDVEASVADAGVAPEVEALVS